MTKAASIDVGTLIEGQRFGRFQIGLMFWICTFMLIEGYDMQVVGYAAPAIIKAWHSDKAAFGVVFGAGLGGFMLGATILGNLGDRFGRKRMIVAGSLLFGLFTLCSAWADGLTSLLVLRTIAGVGLGGSIPNAIALVTEYAPTRERATRVGVMFIGYTVGSALGGVIAAQLIPAWGWPSVFVVGGVLPIAIGVVSLFVLPESVRFLMVTRGRTDLVIGLLRRVRPDLAVPDYASLAIEEENREGLPVAHLFADGRASMTALLWLAYAANMVSLHFLTSWLPTVMAENGVPLAHAVLAAFERRHRWGDARPVRALHRAQARDRHVLPVESDDLAAPGELGEQRVVREGAAEERRHLARRRVARGIQAQEIEPERIACQSEHAAELAGAHDADGHVRGVARGSGLRSTPAVCRSRYVSSAVAISGCRLARMATAHSAALVAPAAPIANVATGTPAGICTIDSSESRPPSDFDCTGTPRTGRVVLAAVMPGRCAAPPAPAISTSRPRARAPEAYSNNRSGVR